MTATKAKSTAAKPQPETIGLVGRCFHIFKNGRIENQGVIRGDLGEGRYLIQFFDWIAGEPSTMEIRQISEMTPGRENSWQFYEDAEHMNFWYRYRYNESKDEAAE